MEDSGADCPFLLDLDTRQLNRWSSACKIWLNLENRKAGLLRAALGAFTESPGVETKLREPCTPTGRNRMSLAPGTGPTLSSGSAHVQEIQARVLSCSRRTQSAKSRLLNSTGQTTSALQQTPGKEQRQPASQTARQTDLRAAVLFLNCSAHWCLERPV